MDRGGNHQRPHDTMSSQYLCHNTILLRFSTYCNILRYIAIDYLFSNFKFFPILNYVPKRKLCQHLFDDFSVCSSYFNFIASNWDCQADKLTNTNVIKDRYLASVYWYSIATENIAILCWIDFFFPPPLIMGECWARIHVTASCRAGYRSSISF